MFQCCSHTDFINVADDVDSILNVKYIGTWEAGSNGGWLVVQVYSE